MARKRVRTGTCCICRKIGDLSFEHVPPQSAFNKATAIEYTLESWTTKRKVKGKHRQGGIGGYTLCEQCNNDTGSWYADEYVKWAKTAFDILSLMERNSAHFSNKAEIAVMLKRVYPLRFLKQVVTCLFSVVSNGPDAEFARNHPDLVSFVLNKHETHLSQDFQFFLRLHQSQLIRHYPIAGKISVTYDKDESGNIVRHSMRVAGQPNIISEMAHPPFALIMTYGTDFPESTNITHLSSYGYDDEVDLLLPLIAGRGLTPYPGSFHPL